jgi:hypothetical protein
MTTFEMKKMILKEMTDAELGKLAVNIETMINLSGKNILGNAVSMMCNECVKRPNTTDVNILRIQDLMIRSLYKREGIDYE